MNFKGIELDELFLYFIYVVYLFIFINRKSNEFKRCGHECEKGILCGEWMCNYFYRVKGLY